MAMKAGTDNPIEANRMPAGLQPGIACVRVVDTLVGGDLLRIVVEGSPPLRATTAAAALAELRAHHDDYRSFLIDPPRGHAGVNAGLLLPALVPDCDRTLVVAAQFGYAPIAGTVVMAAAAVLSAMAPPGSPGNESGFTFDTAAGPSRAAVRAEATTAWSARWTTQPPRILARALRLPLANGREAGVTVVDSGLPYVVASTAELGIAPGDRQALASAGAALTRAANAALPLVGTGMGEAVSSHVAMLTGAPRRGSFDGESGVEVPVAWVSVTGIVAESAGGTGALAVATHLEATGVIAAGTPVFTVPPSGSGFRCRIVDGRGEVEATVTLLSVLDLLAPEPAAR